MRTHTITSVILSLFCIAAFAQESPSAYGAAYAAWEARPTDRASASESVAAFDKLRVAWSNASTFERDHAAYYFALAAVTTAANAPSEEAGRLLGVAAKVAAEYPIVLSRGKSPKRFEQFMPVFGVQIKWTPLQERPSATKWHLAEAGSSPCKSRRKSIRLWPSMLDQSSATRKESDCFLI
jgi:hypothetical protein